MSLNSYKMRWLSKRTMSTSRNILWYSPKRWLTFLGIMLASCVIFAWLPTSMSSALDGKEVGHWTSVLPPLLATIVALCFHSLIGALISAFLLGTFLAYWPNVLTAVPLGIKDFIWINLTEQFNLYIFAFLFTLIGMIHVIYKGGGIHGLVSLVNRVAVGPRSTKVATFLAGLIVFFDDYSNTVVVGSTMRTLSDRWKISREKLAYIVDSTTAPIAGIALVSTWIAFEVFLFGDVAQSLGLKEGGYLIFLTILPYRFYCWGTLLFVFMTSAMGRDFGPMFHAEYRAATQGKLLGDEATPLIRSGGDALEPSPEKPSRWLNAVLPLTVVVFGTLLGILALGRMKVLDSGASFSFFILSDWRTAFSMVTNPAITPGGAMKVLFFASLAGTLLALLLVVAQRILTIKEAGRAYLRALPTLGMAFFILIMAWGMSKICTNGVHTDTYLISLMGDHVPHMVLPCLVFLLASGMAFATGTSFGTMAILIPMILPLAYALGAYDPANQIIFWLTCAAILDGAIFGDHCSPISDTTVLSSISAGCDHIDHVKTQIPYAMTVMVLVSVVGYLATAAGMSGWLFFMMYPLLTFALLICIGRKVPSPLE